MRASSKNKYSPELERWRDFKFGMFIHYGLYSLIGEGEWVMFKKPIDKDEYREWKNSESIAVIKISMDRSVSSIYESFDAENFSAFSS